MLDRLKDMDLAPNVNVVALCGGHAGATQNEYAPSILVRNHDEGWENVSEMDDQAKAIFSTDEEGRRELDTSDHRTLASFIRWALAKYSANQTMLSIIGHGGGLALTLITLRTKGGGGISPSLLGLCPDDSRMTAISIPELGRALSNGLHGKRKQNSNARLDVVFLDACLMGMVEVGYEIREHADYLVAGENLLSFGRAGDGLPYDAYLGLLKENPAPETLAAQIVENYNTTTPQKAWTIAAVKTDRLSALKDLIKALAIALKAAIESDRAVREAIHAAYASAQKLDQNADQLIDANREGYVDLFDFAFNLNKQLQGNPRHETVSDIAQAIMHAIGENRRTVASVDASGTSQPCEPQRRLTTSPDHSVVVRTHTQSDSQDPPQNLDHAYGLSIYLPLGEAQEGEPSRPIEKASYLAYYTDPGQLLFTRDAPEWASLLVELTAGASLQPSA